MRTLCAAIAVALFITCAPTLAATTGEIVGTVTDAQSHAPIADAAVTATAPTGSYRTKTDSKGIFTIVGAVPDTYTVTASAPGYLLVSVPGLTVTTDEATRVTITLSRNIKSLAIVHVRSATSAYQPDQTVDRYTLSSTGINQLLGKSFATDQKQLLRELPSVTIDKNGTALIRGGFSFQTSFQFEGIDYTEPSQSVANRFENIGNSNILNGVGSLEIIPGGGDATHGDTGTGLVSMLAKRGTYPATGTFDSEVSLNGLGRQFATEFGISGPHSYGLSNYFSFIALNEAYQWGHYGVNAASIGAAAFATDPTQNSNINAHTGALWTSAFYNPANQQVRDFLDNLVYKFGKSNQESLQAFVQNEGVIQNLDYGGYGYLNTIDPASLITGEQRLLPTFLYIFGQGVLPRTLRPYLPTTPGGVAGAPLTSPEYNVSPFTAYKLEYQDLLSASTALGIRYFRTFADQQEYLPAQGIYVPANGGIRTGVTSDISRAVGTKHYLQAGVKYEFAHPYGIQEDNVDYLLAFDSLYNIPSFNQIPVTSGGDIIPDFIVPQPVTVNGMGQIVSGTPGCSATYVPGSGDPYPSPHPFDCGYLAKYFPHGIPPIPTEQEIPTANQQVYGAYLQDTITPNARIKMLLGVRLDGYNFLLPGDVQDPPAVDGIRHQRLYEPHVGFAYKFSDSDAARLNFGRTLAIPLPTFLGDDIDRSIFAPFQNIPSFDNMTGLPAMYCGPGVLKYNPLTATMQFAGTQLCTSYADQLYWLERNYRFGLQGTLHYPLRGSTFTNYDLSWDHLFRNGVATKLTPFYRRGYDIVETTRTLEGVDVTTGAALFSPAAYSNLGFQRATGVELDLTSPIRPLGWSEQMTATYINQLGNDPPGGFLPTASLQLGNVYHSPNIAPLQATFAFTYREPHYGWTFNPVFTFHSGYPYGQGIYQAVTYNGKPLFIPITDALYSSSQAALITPAWVNPQNPGSIYNPNIAGTQGSEGLYSGPGTLTSHSSMITDLTIAWTPPAYRRITYGMYIQNLFSNVSDVPVVNLARDCQPVSTGVCGNLPGSGSSIDPTHLPPVGQGGFGSSGPYIVFPNQEPINVSLYAQASL